MSVLFEESQFLPKYEGTESPVDRISLTSLRLSLVYFPVFLSGPQVMLFTKLLVMKTFSSD
jgi:hypothetical protein